MKYTKLMVLLLFVIGSCNKMELPEDTGNPEDKEEPEVPLPPSDDEIFSVSEALAASADTDIYLKGYIVGYVNGASIKSGAQFSLPTDKENTNLLLADHAQETDATNCIAVKLEKTGNFATRDFLNLIDHPEIFGKIIKINGYLAKYFSKNGITRIYAFETTDTEEDNTGPSTGDTIQTPQIDDNETFVAAGR